MPPQSMQAWMISASFRLVMTSLHKLWIRQTRYSIEFFPQVPLYITPMKQVTFTEEPGATWVMLAAPVIEQLPIYFSTSFTWLVQRHIQTPLLHSYQTQTNTIAPATKRKRTAALPALKDHSLCAWRLAITDKLCSTG